jgi:hypothetical protein
VRTHTEPSDAIPTAVGFSGGVDVSVIDFKTVYIFGTFVATLQVQISPDGTNWFNAGSPFTASGYMDLNSITKKIRISVTAYTSGTPSYTVMGRYAQGG